NNSVSSFTFVDLLTQRIQFCAKQNVSIQDAVILGNYGLKQTIKVFIVKHEKPTWKLFVNNSETKLVCQNETTYTINLNAENFKVIQELNEDSVRASNDFLRQNDRDAVFD